MMDKSKKWYQKTLGIVGLLILFFPLGLFLMWKYAEWDKKIKWIITGIFILLLIASSVTGGNKQTTQVETKVKKDINYEIIKTWSIPNGGQGKVIVISPNYLNDEDMVLLGDKLKEDTKQDRNAFGKNTGVPYISARSQMFCLSLRNSYA